jgi:hypothetical protein
MQGGADGQNDLEGRTYNQFAGLLRNPEAITPEDVAYFRHEVFADGVVSRQEAEAVLSLNNGIQSKCPEWDEYFVEALSDYLVNQAEPRGQVSHANAEWLIEFVTRDGRLEPTNELELLVKAMEKAESSPELLVGFALNVVAKAALEGSGPLASGRQLEPGRIGAGEVELIRRVLYAYGGNKGISISRTEAEILFDLNDRTKDADNHPSWRELFVKAIANYLMAVATERQPSRIEAITPESWAERPDTNVSETLSGAVRGFGELFSKAFLVGLFDSAHEQSEKAWAERNARMEAAMAEAEQVSDVEAEWLIEKLNADGVISNNEIAMLAFIRTNGGRVSEKLESVIQHNLANR